MVKPIMFSIRNFNLKLNVAVISNSGIVNFPLFKIYLNNVPLNFPKPYLNDLLNVLN